MKSSYRAITGHERIKIFHTSTGVKATKRRNRVISRLNTQLESKTKSVYDSITQTLSNAPLEEKDISRIQKELGVLKAKI